MKLALRCSLGAAALASAASLGCARRGVVSVSVEPPPPLPSTEYVVGDSVLRRSVSVRNPRQREANGLLETQFDLENRTARDLRLEYAFEWTDGDGFKIGVPTEHWNPLVLGGRETKKIQAIAPRPGAVRWTLHVRRPREVPR